MQAYPYFGFMKSDFTVTKNLANEILSISMYPELTEEQIECVCEKQKLFIKAYNVLNSL